MASASAAIIISIQTHVAEHLRTDNHALMVYRIVGMILSVVLFIIVFHIGSVGLTILMCAAPEDNTDPSTAWAEKECLPVYETKHAATDSSLRSKPDLDTTRQELACASPLHPSTWFLWTITAFRHATVKSSLLCCILYYGLTVSHLVFFDCVSKGLMFWGFAFFYLSALIPFWYFRLFWIHNMLGQTSVTMQTVKNIVCSPHLIPYASIVAAAMMQLITLFLAVIFGLITSLNQQDMWTMPGCYIAFCVLVVAVLKLIQVSIALVRCEAALIPADAPTIVPIHRQSILKDSKKEYFGFDLLSRAMKSVEWKTVANVAIGYIVWFLALAIVVCMPAL